MNSFSTKLVVLLLRVLAMFPLPFLRWLGLVYGRTLLLTKSRAARTTTTNISLCYPELNTEEQKKLVRESLNHSGCTVFETAGIWYWRKSMLKQLLLDFEGEEYLRHQLSKGPVIVVCPHWGNWELLSYILGARIQTTVLYDERRLGNFESLITQSRSRFGLMSMVPISPKGLRQLMQTIKNNGLVLTLPDQVPTRGNHVLVEFMGVQAQTTSLIHALSSRSNATVALITVQRVPKGFIARVEPAADSVYQDNIAAATQALNDEIARVIRRDPAQYQWEYKRFRRVPGRDVYQMSKDS